MQRRSIDAEQCGGRPGIRGMRICVSDVLDLPANGLTPQEVVDELPDPELTGTQACLPYAGRENQSSHRRPSMIRVDAQLSPGLAAWIVSQFNHPA